MTTMINEVISKHEDFISKLSCSTLTCLRNQTRLSTDELIRLNTYSNEDPHLNYLSPLEYPFPFLQNFEMKNNSFNPLRSKFFRQSVNLLPEQMPILLTISSSTNHHLVKDENFRTDNDFINYLINYAYTKWNSKTREYYFDRYLFNYHKQILAPVLKYAYFLPRARDVHLVERHSNRFVSELPFTFGYVLAPSLSVFNETYKNASEEERIESMKTMDLFANLIHTG